MNDDTIRFSIKDGLEAIREDEGIGSALVGIFIGIVFHWIYEIAIAALKDPNGVWNFGKPGIIAARLVIAGIVSFGFVLGFYKSLPPNTSKKMRFINAIAYGLAIDALAGPVLPS